MASISKARSLYWASYYGNEEEVKLLLESGADVNAQGGRYGNALQAASFQGHDKVVKLLLEAGANLNVEDESQGTALQTASFKGHEEVVKLLLEAGADVNAKGGKYGTALQAASFTGSLTGGNLSVIQLLLERGADVNAEGGLYSTALQAASFSSNLSRGNLSVIQLLLDRGADVNAEGGQYGTALQAALYAYSSRGGNSGMIHLLLENGVDINAQDLSHLRARALFRGDDDIVELLEQKAKVDPGEMQAVSSSIDYAKEVRLLLVKEVDVNAKRGQHNYTLQTASHRSHESPTLKVAAESDLIPDVATHVPVSEAIEDNSSISGKSVISYGDEDFEMVVPSDDGSGSGYEIKSDEDEDVATDDSALPEHDSPLANLKNRISNPVEYFDGLGNLAHLVYQHSTLRLYATSWTVGEMEKHSEPCPGYPQAKELTPDGFDPIPDSYVLQICRDVGVFHNAFANDLLEILECRNVNAQTYSNLKRLQIDGFCLQKFNMLTTDPYRKDVARLLPIDIQQISQLLNEIELVLRKAIYFARRAPLVTSSANVVLEQALEEPDNPLLSVPRCMGFLVTLGLVLASPSDTSINLPILAVLRLVVHTADLAVASYAGAHLDRFDEQYLREEIDAIDVLSPFTSPQNSQVPSIKLSRCQLQCLDSFHDSKSVWVFSSSYWEPPGHLFLSTKVEDFADIWGPLWKVNDAEKHNSCTRYVVGNGCIYKWKSQKGTPPLLKNETLCHWIPNSTIEAGLDYSEKPVFPDIVDEAFDGNETLLIGAVAAGCERLTIKRDCNFDLGGSRSELDQDGRVQMLGTVKEHTYKDSETYQLQAGHGGINVSAAKQYKRRGQSLKQAFVEAWMTTPDLRDPRLLQDFHGLEVSMCTQNAQRIQLDRILGLGSMCRYLNSFSWKTECAKRAYFDALKGFGDDGDALQHTWERHNQYREDFGRAILVCLKALEKTGINHRGQLSTLLSSEVTARPELIAMEPREHSWIGLLKDSESSCCMAVIGDECLEFRDSHGSICGQSGRSVLRTALMINRRNMPRGICKKEAYRHEATDGWTSRWSVRSMELGSDLWLGDHGTLRLLPHLHEGTLLMDWRASTFSTAVKSFIDKEKPHREYSANIRKEARRERPIPLFVMSRPWKSV